jgi:hypothetical protein
MTDEVRLQIAEFGLQIAVQSAIDLQSELCQLKCQVSPR